MNSLEQLQTIAQQTTAARTECLGSVTRPAWIYGAGTFGRDVAAALKGRGIPVRGFIEQAPNKKSAWGLPVASLSECTIGSGNDTVLVAVFNRLHPLSKIRQDLAASGFYKVLMPWDYYGQLADTLGWRYWLEDAGFLSRHWDNLESVMSRLVDPISRQCLLDVIAFRSGLHLGYATERHGLPQYFNELTLPHLPGKIHYVDGGAFDGDTFLTLAQQARIGQAWLFEPDSTNFSKLRRQVAEKSEGTNHLLPMALSDRHERLTFTDGIGEASCISASGSVAITAVALDDVVGNSPVNFIKLDVEGGEHAALLGARRTITQHAPVLALSAYHRPEDLWNLIQVIDDFGCRYRYALRQHHFNSFDLVLYATTE
jgi:FkbM family methyltransferase